MTALVPIRAADLFCGAGGTSSGLYMAADELRRDVDLLAVNHWNVAIATHSANHSEALHLCETLDGVNPRRIIPRGRLDLLVASPECTHHSNARGGRPREEQSRASAWHVVRWAEALRIESILVENVREFLTWGPLGSNGQPLKSRKGETFLAWVAALKSLNYRVTYGILNAADYGDPTTRERLFVMAKLGSRRPLFMPAPTHSAEPEKTGLLPWRSARDHVIDWSDRGVSIFNRPNPLSLKTIGRIAAGFHRHGGLDLRPFLEGFIVKLYGTGKAASARRPLPSVTAKGNHLYVAQPMLLGQQSGSAARPVSKPVMTVAGGGAIAKVNACLVEYNGTGSASGTSKPVKTITGKPRFALAEAAFIAEYHGGKDAVRRTRSISKPLGVQTTEPRFGLAQPSFILPKRGRYGNNQPRSTERPTQTVVPHHGLGHLVETAFLAAHFGERKGQDPRTHSIKRPAPTVTRRGAGDLAQSVMLSAGGPECPARPTSKPAHTVLTRDHIGVSTVVPVTHAEGKRKRAHDPGRPLPAVTTARRGELAVANAELVVHGPEPVRVGGRIAHAAIVQVQLDGRPHRALHLTFEDGTSCTIDILFRMLRPRELARAQGFPDDYKFTGKTEDVVKQIGNAVPVNLAKALCKAALA